MGKNARKPILTLDFDGVIHSYTSGWKGPRVIPDPPVTVPMEPGRYRMSVPVEISACNLPCSHGDETGCKRLLLTWPDGDVNCADAFFNGATFTREINYILGFNGRYEAVPLGQR